MYYMPFFGHGETISCKKSMKAGVTACVSTQAESKLSHHVNIEKTDYGVLLSTNDADIRFHADCGYWEVSWKWVDLIEPNGFGSSVGEYSRSHLTEQQEEQFSSEVEMWIDEGWPVPHDLTTHGTPAAVHSSSTRT